MRRSALVIIAASLAFFGGCEDAPVAKEVKKADDEKTDEKKSDEKKAADEKTDEKAADEKKE